MKEKLIFNSTQCLQHFFFLFKTMKKLVGFYVTNRSNFTNREIVSCAAFAAIWSTTFYNIGISDGLSNSSYTYMIFIISVLELIVQPKYTLQRKITKTQRWSCRNVLNPMVLEKSRIIKSKLRKLKHEQFITLVIIIKI